MDKSISRDCIPKTEIPIDLHGNAKVRTYSTDHTRQILLMFLQSGTATINRSYDPCATWMVGFDLKIFLSGYLFYPAGVQTCSNTDFYKDGGGTSKHTKQQNQ